MKFAIGKSVTQWFVTAGAVALLITTATTAMASAPSGYSLVWSDEFNQGLGLSPNSSNWTFDTGAGGWGNNELETYVTDTAHCSIVSDSNASDGMALQITATKDIVNSRTQYHSARIKTLNKVMPQYGWVGARIQLPYGQGIWPAFWSMGSNYPTTGWPGCGEADIMENGGNSSWYAQNMSTIIGPGYSSSPFLSTYYNLKSGYFYQAYHLFQEQWTPSTLSFYVDGTLVVSWHQGDVIPNAWPFNQPMFFLTNVAVGGSLPGNPDATTVWPQHMNIDYVRVYQSTAGTPAAPTGLSTTAQSNQIKLSWSAVSGASAYNVYRGTSSGGEQLLMANVAGTSFTDVGLANGSNYYYTLTALNDAAESSASSEVSAAPVAGVATTTVDPMTSTSNWSVNGGTTSWQSDITNPTYFDGDHQRINRSRNTVQTLIWSYPNISGFVAKVYTYYGPISTVTVYYSTNNGSSYTQAPVNYGSETKNSSGWGYYNVTPTLPGGVTNVKLQVGTGTGYNWDPEISQVTFSHT